MLAIADRGITVQQNLFSSRQKSKFVFRVHFAFVLALILMPSVGAEDKIAYAGIVKADGKPVEGATVWLTTIRFHHTPLHKIEILATETTDKQGKFAFHRPHDAYITSLYARSPDGRFQEIDEFMRDDFLDPQNITIDLIQGKNSLVNSSTTKTLRCGTAR